MRVALQEIDRRIDALDPGEFQVLGERFLRLAYPDEVPEIAPRGRNARAETITGWPDGYAVGAEGSTVIYEATRAADWASHVESDIKSLGGRPARSVDGYYFVAWGREPAPEVVVDLRQRVVATGVPADRVRLVFRAELTERLSEARFAALCHDVLGIATSAIPFVTIEHSQLFGSGDVEEFAPTLNEYRQGVVDAPSVRAAVEAVLARQGMAFVRGRGASGKTTLAVQLALKVRDAGLPAYYWDLSEADESVDLGQPGPFNVLATRAGPGVLFCLDNVHTAERLARRLHDHWREVIAGSRLLLVGREISRPPLAGKAPPLRELEDPSLILAAGAPEVSGVLRRLARRVGAPLADPPPDYLEGLAAVFGGDLIALAAAVAPKLSGTVHEWPTVGHADAGRHVRERYLAGLDAEAARELLIVCALSWLELGASEDIIDVSRLGPVLSQGAVQEVVGTAGRRYLRTVHPGLGDLIGRAGSVSGDHATALTEALQRRPGLGPHIARRLARLGEEKLATALLRQVAADDGKLAIALIGRAAAYLHSSFEEFAARDLVTPARADRVLSDLADELAGALAGAEPSQLARSLNWLRSTLPEAYQNVVTCLLDADVIRGLAQRFCELSFRSISTSLDPVAAHLPPLVEATIEELARREDRWRELVLWVVGGPINKTKRRRLTRHLRDYEPGLRLFDSAVQRHGVALLRSELPLDNLRKAKLASRWVVQPLVALAATDAGREALIDRARSGTPGLLEVLAYARQDAVLLQQMEAWADTLGPLRLVSVKPGPMLRAMRGAQVTAPTLARAIMSASLEPDHVDPFIDGLVDMPLSVIEGMADLAARCGLGQAFDDALDWAGAPPVLAGRLDVATFETYTSIVLGPLGPVLAADLSPTPALVPRVNRRRRRPGARRLPPRLSPRLVDRLRELGRPDVVNYLERWMVDLALSHETDDED